MQNATTESPSLIFHREMVEAHMLTAPLGLITLYITCSQIAYLLLKRSYEKKHNACQKPRVRGRHVYGNRGGHVYISNKRKNTNHQYTMTTLCIFASFTALLRSGIDPRLIYGSHDDFGCNVVNKFKVLTFSLSLASFYLVLWLRQRVFYQESRHKLLSSQYLNVFSWAICAILLIMIIIETAIFGIGSNLEAWSLGCRVIPNNLSTIRWYILISGTTVFQVSLLSVFIYPLVKHFRSTRAVRSSLNRNNPLIRLIKRTTIIAVISIITDIISVIIILVVRSSQLFSNRLYDVNNVINVVCVIFVFADWRERLMPWRLRKPEIRTKYVTTVSENDLDHMATIFS